MFEYFFSVIGKIIIPNNIKKGIFTASQIGKYVEGKSLAYIMRPNVVVPTLLKWFALILMVSINNEGSIQKKGLNRKVNKIILDKKNKNFR